jgi:O-antigen ligase
MNRNMNTTKVGLVCIYLFGVLIYSYPPFTVTYGQTEVLRSDFFLVVPMVAYFLFYHRFVVTDVTRYVFLFLTAILLATALNKVYSIFDFLTLVIQLAYVTGVFVVLVSLDFSEQEWKTVLRGVVLCLGLLAGFGLLEVIVTNIFRDLAFSNIFLHIEQANPGVYHRPRSLFQEPAWFGAAMLVGIGVLVPCVSADHPVLFSNRTEYALTAILTVALLTTLSFTVYLTFLASLGIFLMFRDTRAFVIKLGLIATAGLLLAVVSPIDLPSLFFIRIDRLIQLATTLELPRIGSIHLRVGSVIIGLLVWSHNPFLGVGLGQYYEWQRTVMTVQIFGLSELKAAHNVWVQVLAVSGIVGFVLFVFIWLRVFQTGAWHLIGESDKDRDGVLTVVAVATTAIMLVNWTFGQSLVNPMKWAFLGLMYAYLVPTADETDPSHQQGSNRRASERDL